MRARDRARPAGIHAARVPGRPRDHRRDGRDGDAVDQRARPGQPGRGRDAAASGRCCARRARKRSCRASTSRSSSASTEYEFLRFDTRRNEWRQVADDSLYAPRTLPAGLRFRLWLEGRELVLKPGLPDRSKKDENQKWPPQLTVLSSGDVVPFELQLERDDRTGVVAHDFPGGRRPARRAAQERSG